MDVIGDSEKNEALRKRLGYWALCNGIGESSDTIDGNGDLIARAQGKVRSGHDSRTSHQENSCRETCFAKEKTDQFLGRALHLLQLRFVLEGDFIPPMNL